MKTSEASFGEAKTHKVFEQARHGGQMREQSATTQGRQVRASCNILSGMDFLSRKKNCADSWKAIFSGFAQSVLKNVESHDVVSRL